MKRLNSMINLRKEYDYGGMYWKAYLKEPIEKIATLEGLPKHYESVKIRFESPS